LPDLIILWRKAARQYEKKASRSAPALPG